MDGGCLCFEIVKCLRLSFIVWKKDAKEFKFLPMPPLRREAMEMGLIYTIHFMYVKIEKLFHVDIFFFQFINHILHLFFYQ